MKLKKHITHDGPFIIWRLMLNGGSCLLIEERDVEKKEAYYSCYDLNSGKPLFNRITFAEKFWTGVEEFTGDTIFFHNFLKPDMPYHKGIFAYSVTERKVIWRNETLTYGFLLDDKVFAYEERFEGRTYIALDHLTGNAARELYDDPALIHTLTGQAREAKDYSAYVFPEKYVRGIDAEVDRIINVESDGALPEIEYLRWANTLFYTVQRQNKQGGYDQTLFCVAIATKKVIFKEIINRNQRALLFDSFFVYDRYLISIHDKTSVMVFVLQE